MNIYSDQCMNDLQSLRASRPRASGFRPAGGPALIPWVSHAPPHQSFQRSYLSTFGVPEAYVSSDIIPQFVQLDVSTKPVNSVIMQLFTEVLPFV